MKEIKLSLIIPLFNRPEEIDELLESLDKQTSRDFEVIVVEDGSQVDAADIIRKYESNLNLRYLVKENGGPGPARNFGAAHATGDYLVFLDSDCIIPEVYVEEVQNTLQSNYTDAYGGPDGAHPSFTPVQKSINYAMTSMISTGGIRGSKTSMEKFHPRSFNMGIAAEVFKTLEGFSQMRFGEDVDLSIRLMQNNFTTQLIPEAYVYHKRRTDFRKFFKQVHNSGIARINLHKRHPGSLKLVHVLPSVFVVTAAVLLILAWCCYPPALYPLCLLAVIIFGEAMYREKNLEVALLSIPAVFIELTGYGSGFMRAFWQRIVLGKDEFEAFRDSFYK